MDILGQLGGGKLDINRMGNKIYFYEDIYKETVLPLIKEIQTLTYELQLQGSKYGFEPHIDLHIYSPGGDAFMDYLFMILSRKILYQSILILMEILLKLQHLCF